MSNKEKILIYIVSYKIPDKMMRNSMCCNESWYNAYYAIKETFSIGEIQSMSDKEIENLVKLANEIGLALY